MPAEPKLSRILDRMISLLEFSGDAYAYSTVGRVHEGDPGGASIAPGEAALYVTSVSQPDSSPLSLGAERLAAQISVVGLARPDDTRPATRRAAALALASDVRRALQTDALLTADGEHLLITPLRVDLVELTLGPIGYAGAPTIALQIQAEYVVDYGGGL